MSLCGERLLADSRGDASYQGRMALRPGERTGERMQICFRLAAYTPPVTAARCALAREWPTYGLSRMPSRTLPLRSLVVPPWLLSVLANGRRVAPAGGTKEAAPRRPHWTLDGLTTRARQRSGWTSVNTACSRTGLANGREACRGQQPATSTRGRPSSSRGTAGLGDYLWAPVVGVT